LLIAGDQRLSYAEMEIRKLRLAPLLDGYRGSPKLDVSAVADIVRNLGELVAGTPAIRNRPQSGCRLPGRRRRCCARRDYLR
jgi:hypothetical protein